MQKIVLFIEPQEEYLSEKKEIFETPSKIGNLFMNRFAIDEDGCNEILKIYYLKNRIWDYDMGTLTKKEGPDRIIQ